MKNVKRFFSLLLVLVTLCSTLAVPAFAASTWPSLSSSGYCEMISPGKISVYRDTSLKTRGTSSPAKSYNAYASKNDKIYILKVTASYTQISYPVSSGGRRIGYVKTSTLFGVTAPTEQITSKAKVTTYTGASTSSRSGSTAVGDCVYKLGTTKSGFVLIMYTAKSGNRSMKAAFVTKADYEKIKHGASENVSSSGWQWPMSGYWVTQAFNRKRNSSSRPYHCGIDIKSNNTNVYAAASGTVVYKGYSDGNGYHVVIAHNLNGTTVKTLYSHLSNYNKCPAVGQTVNKGAQIGVMGNTGNSTGPHLHFAIYTGNSNDPWGYASSGGANKISYGGCVFYNPAYVIANGKLP